MRPALLILLALLAFLPTVHAQIFRNSAATIPRTTLFDAHLAYTQQRFQKNQEALQSAPRPIDLILDGDSITDFWKTEGRDVWAQNFADRRAFDFGVSGDRTQHLLWRLSQGQLDGLSPRLVALMIGTNNLGSNSPEQIAEGIKAIVTRYRELTPGAVILLQGIFPRGQSPNDPARTQIKKINQLISTLADGQHIIYLDFGDKFLAPDGTISPDIMPDYLHLSPKGYDIWAQAIRPIIDRHCPAP